MTDFDPNPWVRALEKLLDYTASGVGAVAGPMLAPWQARREAAALQIAAEGEAGALLIIAAAQAEARETLVSAATDVRGEIDIAETVRQRIQFQEEKRHRNIGSVVGQTAELLGDKDVPDQEPDHDWSARFFNYIQDVSSDEMQLLWAKVLAGQIAQPGSVSIRALSILRNMDQPTAELFLVLRSACISLAPDGMNILDARVPSLGGDANQNALRQFGLSFDNLNVLNEQGLIIGDYRSWYDIRMCVSTFGMIDNRENVLIRVPFKFQDRYWVLEPQAEHEAGSEYRVSGVALTQAGRELSTIVDCQPMPEYHHALEGFLSSQAMIMTEVSGPTPEIWQPTNA